MSRNFPRLFKRLSSEAGHQPAGLVWVNANGMLSSTHGGNAASIVLPRSLVRHAYWDIGTLKGRALRSAVEVRLAAWRPFAAYQAVVVPGEGGVSVFAWDRQRLATILAPSGLAPEQVTAWPESLLQEAESETGCRLFTCRDGYEGQCWQNGELRASRWWAAIPTDTEWQNFLRVARVPAELAPAAPEPIDCASRSTPWEAARHLDQLVEHERFRWHLLVAGVVLLAVLPLVWLIYQERTWEEAERVYQQQYAALMKKTRPFEQARESYLRDFDFLESLQVLPKKYPDGLVVMAGLSKALISLEAQLLALSWDQGTLQLTLRPNGEMLPRLRYVEVLGALPWLTSVRETDASKGDELVFEAQVTSTEETQAASDEVVVQQALLFAAGSGSGTGV